MKKTISTLALFVAVATSSAAMADNSMAVGVYGGTTGVGLGLTYKLTEAVNLRGIVSRLDFNYETDVDDLEYDLDLKMNSIELLVDWHPFANGFRLTGGVMGNDNDFSGDATPRHGAVSFGGYRFTAEQLGEISGEVEYNRIAPYLGVGYGNAFKNRALSFSVDAGVYYMGNPKTKITANAAAGSEWIQPWLNQAAAQEEATLKKDAKDLRYYPLLRVGLNYAF